MAGRLDHIPAPFSAEAACQSVGSQLPVGFRWRGSYWFTTFVVGLGIATDLLVYSIIIPVMPFHLQRLGYHEVSSLSGWLLFSYSAGLALCLIQNSDFALPALIMTLATIPIAMLSERYNARKMPLILGLVVLLGSQIMLMEVHIYAVMCVSRILQGIGSSMVWVVGLALLCDAAPERFIGRQLGIAMAGLSIGLLVGPPVGGALYSRFGFRGPFVFGMAVTLLDLLGRLLIIEPKDAIRYGINPNAVPDNTLSGCKDHGTEFPCDLEKSTDQAKTLAEVPTSTPDTLSSTSGKPKPLSLLGVIIKLSKSPRALVSIIITFVYGLVYTSQEPSIPLHLQSVWGLDSGKVGLVFLAAVVPTLFSSTLTGWIVDRKGAEWVTFASLLLALPWWLIVIIRGPLALFTVAFAIESFFSSGVVSPLTSELAAVARGIDGVGYAHVYGAFNLAYGIGSSVGPVAGGQIYDHAKHGWTALCLLATGLLGGSLVLGFFYVGADPLASKLRRKIKGTSVEVEA